MLLESMIVVLCAGQYGCDPALRAYWETRPDLKQIVKDVEIEGKKIAIEHPVLGYLVPIIVSASQKNVQIPLFTHFSFQADQSKGTLLFKFSY